MDAGSGTSDPSAGDNGWSNVGVVWLKFCDNKTKSGELTAPS